MNQEDLQEQLQSLRQTLEETRRQLSSNPALPPNTVEDMLAPLHRKVAVLEAQVRVAHFDRRETVAQPGPWPPVLDEETALTCCLTHVIEANRRLRLQFSCLCTLIL